jgi:hypothetical protein
MALDLSKAFPFAVAPPCEIFPDIFGKRRDQKTCANIRVIGEQDADARRLLLPTRHVTILTMIPF